jgi:nitroreductase
MSNRSLTNEALLRQLNWRCATKKFDPAKRIAPEDWDTLEQALLLAPSSYGLAPYRFVIVTEAAVREKLSRAAWGQRQPLDCSHFVVFASQRTVTTGDLEDYVNRIAAVREVAPETLAPFRQAMEGDLVKGPRAAIAAEWAARQAYIALGTFLTSAALLGIDACPMEGFDPAQFDEILGLPERGLRAVVAAAAGYRAETDKYAALRKVRKTKENVFLRS